MKWTDDQARVIDTRGQNILVSAAAGSGKTAVLVGRILALLEDPEHPCDIDRLLVVTFTRAAAAQMKDRIRTALEERYALEPENAHLARQLSLIHNAKITTIDGFCSYVLRSYGSEIALEGGFRVANEGEVRLLRMDTLEELFDAEYSEGREEFLLFSDTFAPGRDTSVPGELILQLYDTAFSLPHPLAWLSRCADSCGSESLADWLASDLMQGFLEAAREQILSARQYAGENLSLCAFAAGPSAYKALAEAEYRFFSSLAEAASAPVSTEDAYNALRSMLFSFEYARLSTKKPSPGEDPALREIFKSNRAEHKEIWNTLKGTFFPCSAETAFAIHLKSAAPLRELAALTIKFAALFSEKKNDQNLVDFTDLEQYALQILRDPDDTPTQAARELAARFDHVMIDEYQDSNYLQEALLTAVTKMADGVQNYFMVGDVKQSIYSFRAARPDLFTGKYNTYRPDPDGDRDGGVRIDLHANFRSRHEITDAVNDIFSQIMCREIGGIVYDENAALIAGADYPEDPDGDFTTECMIVCKKEDGVPSDAFADTGKELEARAIGRRILRMVGQERIWDEKAGAFRPVEFRDVVILLRSVTGWTDPFSRILTSMHIPVHTSMKSGYFSAQEVQQTLQFLAILDNPRQDIPLAGVLHSAYVSLSSEDLAKIRAFSKKAASYWDCVRTYAEQGDDPGLRERLFRFLTFYHALRASSKDTPIHVLLFRLLSESGFMDHASAMPDGTQRKANLDMLIEKAAEYEGTSYTGLYHFIRYINSLQKYEVDFGEAGTIGESENTVRILSIHKSKGLEYPVVFVAGMHKRFNRQDLGRTVLIHPAYGIASDAVDTVRRTRTKTAEKAAIAQILRNEATGEELRVLYVAMTRAKQKLILSGLLDDAEALEKRRLLIPASDPMLPEGYLEKTDDFWHVFLPAALRKKSVRFEFVMPSMLVGDEFRKQIREEQFYTQLLSVSEGSCADPALHEVLESHFSYRYPYEGLNRIPVKVSVSELKAAHYYEEEAQQLYETPPVIPLLPEFLMESRASLSGAGRGTVYHKFMELLDYASLPEGSAEDPVLDEEIERQKEMLEKRGVLLTEEAAVIRPEDIRAFLRSGIGIRMHRAAGEGTLRREQPFTYAAPASAVDPSYPESESVLVQGVIDAYFKEGDSLVLVDYKTDRLETPEEFIRHYRIQLETYADALSRLTGLPVTQQYIYSFRLKKEIRVK